MDCCYGWLGWSDIYGWTVVYGWPGIRIMTFMSGSEWSHMYEWTVVYGWLGMRIMYQSGVTFMGGLLFTVVRESG